MSNEISPSTSDKITNQKVGAPGVAALVLFVAFAAAAADKYGLIPNIDKPFAITTPGQLKNPGLVASTSEKK